MIDLDCAPNRNISSVNQNIIGFKRRQISGLFTFVWHSTLENIYFPYQFEIFLGGLHLWHEGRHFYFIYSSGFEINSTAVVYIYKCSYPGEYNNLDGFFKMAIKYKNKKKDQIFLYTFICCLLALFLNAQRHINNGSIIYAFRIVIYSHGCSILVLCVVLYCALSFHRSPAQSESRSSEKEIDYFD